MLMSSNSGVALLGSVLLALIGCSGGQDAPPMASQLNGAPNAWCAALCDYTSRCTGPVPSYCVSSCLRGNSSYFSQVTYEYLLKMAPCMESAACAADVSTMADACYKSITSELTPSAAVIDFCKAMSAKFFECYYSDDDLTFCAADFAPWSDSAAARGKVCASADCSSINDCLSSAFNGTN